MKKFGKILSSVLASTMVISCFAMNSFAAGKQHVLTTTVSKTEGLVAGEEIVVEVKIDNTLNIGNLSLYLQYDESAFEVDTVKPAGRGTVENYIDSEWFKTITDTNGNWGYYFKTPTYSPTSTVSTPGQLSFIYANAIAVEAGYDDNNLTVGKFKFKVKENAANGEYAFTLNDSSTLDGDQSQKVMAVSTPVTVKVGEDAPVVPETKTVGAKAKMNAPKRFADIQGVLVTATNKAGNAGEALVKKADIFGEVAELNAEVVMGLNINNVPADEELTGVTMAWAY